MQFLVFLQGVKSSIKQSLKSHYLPTFASYFKRVPKEGLEPSRHYWQRILSPQRLPFRHSGIYKIKYSNILPRKNRGNSREPPHIKIKIMNFS